MDQQDHDLPSPRTALFGAHRASTNPRLHALSKPYSRPSSYHDAIAGPSSSGNASPPKSPTKQLPSTRPQIPKSLSSSHLGGMTRSGSETSLLSGIRSILSRPLAWLATPSRGQQVASYGGKKRDNGWDEEESGTPTEDIRGTKRIRRRSPSPDPALGEYAPQQNITGRAVTGFMLPPLPPDVSLKPKSKPNGSAPNFSRPLKSSQSMPYLDPPKDLFSPAKKRTTLTRSRRVDMSGLGDDDDMGAEVVEKEQWSPWKESHPGRTRASLTPARYTPMRNGQSTDFGYPSASPFRVPASPSAPRQASGLARSATTSRLRRESTAASDISMDRESYRGGSRYQNGDQDERMSVDGNRREGSVLGQDWYMQDRWQGGSPSARAASVRLGSAAPSSNMPPIRKGQFVWDSEKGFVRENELKAEAPQPVHKNDAERILFALESMRKTPLTKARSSTSSFGEMPPDLVGSSSRSLRKAISVPLATAQAGDSARSKRDKERLGEDYNVMISPYGRRKAVERDERDKRKERSRSEMSQEYRPSASPSRSVASRSEASSHASTDLRSEASLTPSPAPTPRRSARNKRKEEPVEEPTPRAQRSRGKKTDQESAAPKEMPRRRNTRRTTAEKGTSPPPPVNKEPPPPVPTIVETAASPKQNTTSTYQVRDDSAPREKSSLRAKSDISQRKHQSAANSRATSPNGGRYSAREEDLPDMEDLDSTKIQLPSFSGISFAGLTPPAPATKTASAAPPVPSTPAPTTAPSAALSTTPAQTPKSSLTVPSNRPGAGPLSRLNSSRPRASSPLASGSIVAEPASPPETGASATTAVSAPKPDATGFFSLGSTASTTPANPPPLFSNIANDMRTEGPKKGVSFGLGKPSAPPSAEGTSSVPDFFGKKSAPTSGTVSPAAGPAPTGFNFGLPKADEKAEKAAAPTFSFGVKPAEGTSNGGSVFGGKAVVVPETSTKPADAPAAPTTFSFGQPAKRQVEETSGEASSKKSAPFSFSVPKAAESSPPKAAEPTKPAFSFGAPAATPSLDTASSGSQSGFSFGQTSPSPANAPAGAPKSTFSFGQSSSDKPKAPEPAKSFSFGAPAATPSLESTDSGGFSFGQPAVKAVDFGAKAAAPNTAAETSKSPPPVSTANPFGGFGFSKPAEAPKPAEQPKPASSTSFSFGSTQPSTGFSFGQSEPAKTNGVNGTGFGSTPASPAAQNTPAFTFGAPASSAPAQPSAPAAASTPFQFGAPSTTPATGFGSAAPAASTGFGSGFGGFGNALAAPAAQPAPSTPSFTFGASAPAQPAFGGSSTNGFGGSAAAPPSTPGGTSGGFGSGFGFGQQSTTPQATPTTFQFGAANPATPATPATAPAGTGTFNFGATPTGSQPFQFGGAQTTPSTPAGGSTFQFGAPTPGGQPPRFGSPQPAAMGGDGGFSLGMAGDAQAPGSPGRRQIKPLRRTKR